VTYWAHPTAIVDQPAHIGAETKIWHFCHVMAGARIGARCVLGQNVFVAARAVFTNVVNPRAFIERKHEYRATRVGRGASVGANATVVCGHDIGEYAFIGAGAVVTKEVPAYALVAGVPARQIGWVCRCGVRLPEGDSPHCASCGQGYRQTTANGKTALQPEPSP
jgi:UDP-2-acetamido-3-amino-2,3-dideoxy-glucuronate N-acetyltransferase